MDIQPDNIMPLATAHRRGGIHIKNKKSINHFAFYVRDCLGVKTVKRLRRLLEVVMVC